MIIGIGILPNAEIAQNAGLQVDNGIIVNEHMQTSHPDVYSASDVARFFSPIFGRYLRLEHYDLAVKQGKIAGSNMVGKFLAFDDLPYFFSFVFDLRINVYGDMSKYDKVLVRGKPSECGNFTKFYIHEGIINAAMIVNRNEDVNSIKGLIRSREKLSDPTVLSDESIQLVAIPN